MFGSVDKIILSNFKDKRVKIFIGPHANDNVIVLESVMTDYNMAGGFWVLDNKKYILATTVLYIEII